MKTSKKRGSSGCKRMPLEKSGADREDGRRIILPTTNKVATAQLCKRLTAGAGRTLRPVLFPLVEDTDATEEP